MVASYAAVGEKIAAAKYNELVDLVNAQGVARIIPTISSTGGSSAVDATGEVTASGALTQLKITVPAASTYLQIRGRLKYIGGGSGSHTTKLALAGTAEATASSYRGYAFYSNAGAALTPGTSWTQGYTGNRLERVRNFTIDNLGAAQRTSWAEWGLDSDASSNELQITAAFRHTVSTALDGWIYDFTSMGTFVELSLVLEGI